MSERKKVTTKKLLAMKKKGERIACLTAYDFPTARALDTAGIDLILVGDSAAMVVAGMETTLPMTMDEMVFMTRWVSRAKPMALLIADMPFGSYQPDVPMALRNAARFIKEGRAEGVKIEGGRRSAEAAYAMVEDGIPVLGHIGMTPQSTNQFGGYRVQGKSSSDAEGLMEDALALQDAGCFGIVLEAVKSDTAKKITGNLEIPTIGIGAGPDCDGQILVVHDIIGFYNGIEPKFVRRYADVGTTVKKAAKAFLEDVRQGDYPSEDETY